MPTISAEIRRARDFKTCAACGKTIAPRTEYVRAYGYAERGDRPYAIAEHVECAATETREKLHPRAKESRHDDR